MPLKQKAAELELDRTDKWSYAVVVLYGVLYTAIYV
jgi:hypothetical protein